MSDNILVGQTILEVGSTKTDSIIYTGQELLEVGYTKLSNTIFVGQLILELAYRIVPLNKHKKQAWVI